MSRRKRRSRTSRHAAIILLAYAHRYAFPMLALLLPFLLPKPYVILGMGVGFILTGLHTLIGCLCRWKHIYCSFQNAHHQEMTPDDVRWHRIRRSDAYGSPAISLTIGIMMIICSLWML